MKNLGMFVIQDKFCVRGSHISNAAKNSRIRVVKLGEWRNNDRMAGAKVGVAYTR